MYYAELTDQTLRVFRSTKGDSFVVAIVKAILHHERRVGWIATKAHLLRAVLRFHGGDPMSEGRPFCPTELKRFREGISLAKETLGVK